MASADHEAQQLRKGDLQNVVKTRCLIRKFLDAAPQNQQKFNTLFEVKGYLEKLRAEVAGLDEDYTSLIQDHAALNSSRDSLLSQTQRLTADNDIKDFYVQQLHNIMIQGSVGHLPRPYLTSELKKQA